MIDHAQLHEKAIEFNMEDLIFAFGFKRMPGQEVLLRMLMTNKTEEQVQTSTPLQIMINIEEWCNENKVSYYYSINNNSYTFK